MNNIDQLLKDAFTAAYIEAIFFTNSGEPTDELNGTDQFDFAPGTLHHIAHDCASFKILAGSMIPFNCDMGNAGHDFWLTRNGHGAGFWDGDWPDHGDDLTAICGQFKTVEPYVGDDEKIYF